MNVTSGHHKKEKNKTFVAEQLLLVLLKGGLIFWWQLLRTIKFYRIWSVYSPYGRTNPQKSDMEQRSHRKFALFSVHMARCTQLSAVFKHPCRIARPLSWLWEFPVRFRVWISVLLCLTLFISHAASESGPAPARWQYSG